VNGQKRRWRASKSKDWAVVKNTLLLYGVGGLTMESLHMLKCLPWSTLCWCRRCCLEALGMLIFSTKRSDLAAARHICVPYCTPSSPLATPNNLNLLHHPHCVHLQRWQSRFAAYNNEFTYNCSDCNTLPAMLSPTSSATRDVSYCTSGSTACSIECWKSRQYWPAQL